LGSWKHFEKDNIEDISEMLALSNFKEKRRLGPQISHFTMKVEMPGMSETSEI
jgi:hypothetical protein